MTDRSAEAGALPRYAIFGAALAFAGPPIYIHAPSLYATEYGLSLTAIGAILLGLRMLDFGQDPALGWWIGHTKLAKRRLAAGFAVPLAIAMAALFWPDLPLDPGWRLGLSLAIVFTGFSALQILFYASGVALAGQPGRSHAQVAGWREAGVLLGICAACVLPEIAKPVLGPKAAYGAFAILFAVFLLVALALMRRRWPAAPLKQAGGEPAIRLCWRDRTLRGLLAIGLVNALPTGLTATLFLFFVEDRLAAPGHAGPTLLAFFLAAALAAPLWAKAARRWGERSALMAGMAAAICVFILATTLGAGDRLAFYGVAIGSGAAMGADMTLLPAMLSRRLAELEQDGAAAFGLWGFVNKAALALAAGLALPALDLAGYAPGGQNDGAALTALSIAYAAVPCLLKAMALLAFALSSIGRKDRPI